jgi:3-hydroxyisobutyrate/3-hydroxypropionate dehydrogenase
MKAKGAQVFDNTQDLAKNSKFVLTMLPNNDIVTKTYEKMIENGANSDTLFVDSSTVDPSVSQYVQKIVKKAGASFVDAPVSGKIFNLNKKLMSCKTSCL